MNCSDIINDYIKNNADKIASTLIEYLWLLPKKESNLSLFITPSDTIFIEGAKDYNYTHLDILHSTVSNETLIAYSKEYISKIVVREFLDLFSLYEENLKLEEKKSIITSTEYLALKNSNTSKINKLEKENKDLKAKISQLEKEVVQQSAQIYKMKHCSNYIEERDKPDAIANLLGIEPNSGLTGIIASMMNFIDLDKSIFKGEK